MLGFDQTDLILLAVAAFIAVHVLVRLMRARRDQLLAQLREQMEAERVRRIAANKRDKEKSSERKAS
jgi:hypothetical protein